MPHPISPGPSFAVQDDITERDFAHALCMDRTMEGLRDSWNKRWEARNRSEEEKLRQMKGVTEAWGAANDVRFADGTTSMAALDALITLATVVRENPRGVRQLAAGIQDTLARLAEVAMKRAVK